MKQLKIFTFLLINFMVSLFSDVVLRDLSINFNIISSLKPFFLKKYIIESGVYSGLIIVIALLITMAFSKILFGFILPENNYDLLKFCVLSFLNGYIIDIYIYKMNIFSDLNLFYKEVGAGFWGSMAFLFSIIISYSIQKNILPLL